MHLARMNDYEPLQQKVTQLMQLCLSYLLGASLKRLGFDVIAVDKISFKVA